MNSAVFHTERLARIVKNARTDLKPEVCKDVREALQDLLRIRRKDIKESALDGVHVEIMLQAYNTIIYQDILEGIVKGMPHDSARLELFLLNIDMQKHMREEFVQQASNARAEIRAFLSLWNKGNHVVLDAFKRAKEKVFHPARVLVLCMQYLEEEGKRRSAHHLTGYLHLLKAMQKDIDDPVFGVEDALELDVLITNVEEVMKEHGS